MSYKDSERYRKVYSYYRPVPRPTDPGGVSKDYVDEALRAMDWKQSVKYATTGTIVIATNGSAAIDGADLLSDEDRILVKDQASAAENGIYMYYSSTGALTRALDATQDALTCGATVYVESGSVNENRIYTMVTQDPITVGTTAQTWSNILGGGGTPANPSNSVQFNDGGSFGGDANFTFDKTTDTLTVTNISGSLTRLSTGASYILAGPNITVNTNSLGQVEVTGSAGGGGGDVYWSSTTADSIYTSGSVAIRGLDSTVDSPSDIGSDVFFWVSGSLNDGLNRSVFGGDMRISGSLAQGGASNLATGFSSHAEGVGTQAPGGGAHAEGVDTVASGTYSHAEGYITIASGTYSHAEGEGTLSVTSGSHAEGYSTVAGIAALAPYDGGYLGEVSTSVLKLAGDYGDVTGSFPATAPVIFTNFLTYFLGDTVSNSSFDGTNTYITASTSTTLDGPTYVTISPGFSVPAAYEQPVVSQILTHAHAEGYATHAAGTYSHAEGDGTRALGGASHSEGTATTTYGLGSHAEGAGTTTLGSYSHVEGYSSVTSGSYSHAEGDRSIARSDYSHSEGILSLTAGFGAHAEGTGSIAGSQGYVSNDVGSTTPGVIVLDGMIYGDLTGVFTAGSVIVFDDTYVGGPIGPRTFEVASVVYTTNTEITLVDSTVASAFSGIIGILGAAAPLSSSASSPLGDSSHAEGETTLTQGRSSHAEGHGTVSGGAYSHAEGYQSVTLGLGSHAEGQGTSTTGSYSHAEGLGSTAIGQHSHAEGHGSQASGSYSHAGGIYTIASGSGQTTVGQYNLRDNAVSLFVVGDGTGDPDVDRHDVFRVNVGRTEVTGTLAVTGSFEVTGSSFLAGDVLEFSGSLLVSGTSRFEGDLMVTGSVFATVGLSGSLTTLVDGSPYLLAGPNITINTNSLGQVEVTGSAGGGGGDVYWTSTTSNAIFTTGSVAISGGEAGIDAAEDKGADVFFYVSGSINGSGIDDKKAVFGGDVRISGSLSQGDNTTTSGVGKYSHAEGANTWAANEGCHAEGSGTFAGGLYTHTEGKDTYSTGNYAHAEGQNTNADGLGSHAEGYSTISYGIGSHTEGSGSRAHGEYSHAEGKDTSARGDYSHVGGLGTIASGSYQHVAGQYNLRDNTTSLFVVGDGSGDDNTLRHDVLRVNSGSVEVTGSLLVVGSSFMSGAVYVSGAIDVDGNILDVSGSILLTGTFERQAFNQGTYVKLFTSPLGYSSNLFGQVDSAGERFEFPNRDNNFITVSGPSGSAPGTEGGRLHIRAGDALGVGGNGGNIFIDPGGTGSLGTDPGSIFFGAEKGAALIAFNGGPTLGNLAGADTFFVVSGSIAGTGAADKRAVFNGDMVTSGSYLLNVQSGTLGTEPVVLLVSSSHHLTVFTLGNVTASLPTAAHVGTQLIFKDGTGAASTSPQMVSCSVGILDGASTYTLPAVNYSSVTVVKVEQPDTWVIV